MELLVDELLPTCSPSVWPGFVLKSTACQNPGEQIICQCLRGILLQSLISCYLSLLTYSLALYDCTRLSRLVAKQWDSKLWCQIFGYGELHPSGDPTGQPRFIGPSHKICTYFLLPLATSSRGENEVTDEHIPAEFDIVMTRKRPPSQSSDSSSSDNESSVSSATSRNSQKAYNENVESVACQSHRDTESFSWALMRYLILISCKLNVMKMATMCEFGRSEMASCLSSSVMVAMNTVNIWIKQSHSLLRQTVAMKRHEHTSFRPNSLSLPFCEHPHAAPARVLWMLLSEDPIVRDLFDKWTNTYSIKEIRHTTRRDSNNELCEVENYDIFSAGISALSVSELDPCMLVVANPKTVVEIELNPRINSNSECTKVADYHPLNYCVDFDDIYADDRKGPIHLSDFLTIRSHQKIANDCATRKVSCEIHKQNDKILHERNFSNVCVIRNHPHLPHYAMGMTDGSSVIAFWGKNDLVCQIRPKLSNGSPFSRAVTQIMYISEGHRLALSDLSGQLEFYQLHNGQVSMYSRMRCHTKHCFDMTYLASSTLLATCGVSSDGRNVALWDTLLPLHRACVAGFSCHDNGGALCVAYSPTHNLIVTTGRKGDIILFDTRNRRRLSHIHHAHQSPISCLAVEPQRSLYATGSTDGCIKIWSFSDNSEIYSVNNAHANSKQQYVSDGLGYDYIAKTKGTTLQGVSQLSFSNAQYLISAGYEGHLKYFKLPINI